MNHKNIFFSLLLGVSFNYAPSMLSMELPQSKQILDSMPMTTTQRAQAERTVVFFDACKKGLATSVAYFLKQGANVNNRDYCNRTPLHHACVSGNLEVVELLIKHGADRMAKANLGITPLHVACEFGHIEIVKSLVINGKLDINIKNSQGGTPLYFACQGGQPLKEQQAFIDSSNGKNKLNICASQSNHQDSYVNIAKFLINSGANIEAKNDGLATPLHAACQHGQVDTVKLLLEKHANKEVRTAMRWAPIHFACSYNHPATVKCLLDYKVKLNVQTEQKLTPLHFAAAKGLFDMAKDLIIAGDVNLNAQSDVQLTPLHYASQNGYLNIVELLIDNGANKNSVSDLKATPLQLAVVFNHVPIVEYLLKAGADINGKTWQGVTALDYAYDKGNSEIIELFNQYSDAQIISEQQADANMRAFFAELDQEKQQINERRGKNWEKNQLRKEAKKQQPSIIMTNESNINKIQLPGKISPIISNATEKPTAIVITSSNKEILIPTLSTASIINNSPTTATVITSPKQQSENKQVGKLKLSNNSAQIAQPITINNTYQVGYDGKLKWPRSLDKAQEKIMFDHLRMLKSWPKILGLDIKQLKADIFRLRVGKHRVIFSVDTTRCRIIIHEIGLRKNVYKNMKGSL